MTYSIFERPTSTGVDTLDVPAEVEPRPGDPFTITAIAERLWATCDCGSLSSHPTTERGTANLLTWQDRHRACATIGAVR